MRVTNFRSILIFASCVVGITLHSQASHRKHTQDARMSGGFGVKHFHGGNTGGTEYSNTRYHTSCTLTVLAVRHTLDTPEEQRYPRVASLLCNIIYFGSTPIWTNFQADFCLYEAQRGGGCKRRPMRLRKNPDEIIPHLPCSLGELPVVWRKLLANSSRQEVC